MLTKIRDDLYGTYAALHATIYGLLTRGQSLESIQRQSNVLAEYAEKMRVAAEEARRQTELLNRSKRRRALVLTTMATLLLLASLYFIL
jgi:hypothetical protein